MRIAVYGTVGAGKSTLIENILKLLPQEKKYEIFWEPIVDNPYLSDSYSPDEAKQIASTYQLELFMLTQRYKDLKNSSDKENVIYDRGILDSLIFAQCSWLSKRMTDRDWNVYREYFETCVIPHIFDKSEKGYDLIIYLNVTAETSMKRIKKRGRPTELKAPKDFWSTLVDLYNEWFEKFKDKAPFFVIDGNSDNEIEHARIAVEYINKIMK